MGYMGLYGFIWVIWVYMGLYGLYGFIWVYMGLYGFIWVIWVYMGLYGLYGFIWVYMGVYYLIILIQYIGNDQNISQLTELGCFNCSQFPLVESTCGDGSSSLQV